MNRSHGICRLAGILTSLTGALVTLAIAAPGALASRTPPFGGLLQRGNPFPAAHTVVTGGMPGWQITLIAVGAALLAAVLAVLLDRAWAARWRGRDHRLNPDYFGRQGLPGPVPRAAGRAAFDTAAASPDEMTFGWRRGGS
jgi:hypothetical protein